MNRSIPLAFFALPLFVLGTGCSDSILDSAQGESNKDMNVSPVFIDELIPSFCGKGSCEEIYFGNVWLVAGQLPRISWNMDETLWFTDCLVVGKGVSRSDEHQIQIYFTTSDRESRLDVFESVFGIGNRKIPVRVGLSLSREKLGGSEWTPWKETPISRSTLPKRNSGEKPLRDESKITLELTGKSLTATYNDIASAIQSLQDGYEENVSQPVSQIALKRAAESFKPIISSSVRSPQKKNTSANELFSLPELPDGVVADLARMFASTDESEVWRDYCLQFLGCALERTDGVTDADRALARETLVEALSSTNATFAGTALRALRRGAPSDPLVASNALRIARDSSVPSSSRTTALLILEECTPPTTPTSSTASTVSTSSTSSTLAELATAISADPSASPLLRRTAEAVARRHAADAD